VDGRALDGPGKADEADRQAGSGVQQEPEARLVLGTLVVGLGRALLDVALDGGDEEQPCNDVADADGDEAEANLHGAKVPLLVHERKGLNEHEDEGVGETREQRQDQHDGLGEEHLEGADPGGENLLGREAVAEGHQLVGAPDVGTGVLLSPALGDAVHHDGGAGLGDGEEVDDLDKAAEDELHPDGPSETSLAAEPLQRFGKTHTSNPDTSP